ncbi:MAG: hypothetical protein FWD05_10450 [Oscillospiraceae bacterium]|nr:hypothetical protein [Oscillospiraceae bacterium]
MSNETEKITINLGIVELAQIDVLVEQGLYSNRSDLIRTTIRKQLEAHKEDIERSLTPMGSKKQWDWMVGIGGVDKTVLEEYIEHNDKLNISAVGMFIVPKNISAELFEKAVAKCIVRGKLVASDEIKEAIKKMNEQN